jgi:tRNA-dihydrouridine synthase B
MIGSVPIYGDLILAPMVGVTDLPFRCLCRELGSALSYTPCVLDEAILVQSARTLQMAEFATQEEPVAVQLLGREEDPLLAAALVIQECGPQIIDLNLGCPARHVSWRGRGAALLREPQRIARLMTRLARALAVPVTAKIRLGWDDASRNYLEVAHILEDSGAAAIAVHGRTKEQGYSGQADWQAIAEVRRAVHIPVLANGDVRAVEDIAAIKAATGCNAVLIGRAAIGNPWIFARRNAADVPFSERLVMIRRHLTAMTDYYGPRIGVLLFRAHVLKYVSAIPGAHRMRPLLGASKTAAELLGLLETWPVGADTTGGPAVP